MKRKADSTNNGNSAKRLKKAPTSEFQAALEMLGEGGVSEPVHPESPTRSAQETTESKTTAKGASTAAVNYEQMNSSQVTFGKVLPGIGTFGVRYSRK